MRKFEFFIKEIKVDGGRILKELDPLLKDVHIELGKDQIMLQFT